MRLLRTLDEERLEKLKDFETCPLIRRSTDCYNLPSGSDKDFDRMFIKVLEQMPLKVRNQEKAVNGIPKSESEEYEFTIPTFMVLFPRTCPTIFRFYKDEENQNQKV